MSRDDCMDAGGRATQDAEAEAWTPGATKSEEFLKEGAHIYKEV
jgi:hypothetical protein